MQVTVEGKIYEALFNHLATLTLSPALPIAEQGVEFEPPEGGNYLSVAYLPNTTDRLFIANLGKHRHKGILQVSVMWQKQESEIFPREVAGMIANHFNDDTRLPFDGGEVRFEKRPDVAPMLQEGNVSMIPVSINYYSFA